MQSSTLASSGMLMVLEMAPEMNGCAAAIMRIWLSTERKRLPLRPQGEAQSNTGKCLGSSPGAPSSVMAPQAYSLADSISRLPKPISASRSKSG